MIESLLPLLLVLAGFQAWQNALRSRELARDLGRDLCAAARVQLLDQTVALQRLRLVRVPARGVQVRRDYRFDFSVDGSDRQRGTLSVLDGRLLSHNMALAVESAAPLPSNVIMLPSPQTRRH